MFKFLNIDEGPYDSESDFIFSGPLPVPLTIGLVYPIPDFNHLTSPSETYNRLFYLSKRRTRTLDFETAVTLILDKYLEFDASDLRRGILRHSESYGPNKITLTVDKDVQQRFEEHGAPLWKCCQYIVGTAEETYLYSNIKLKHLTLSEVEYLEEQLKERDIKVALTIHYLVLSFPYAVKEVNPYDTEIDGTFYSPGTLCRILHNIQVRNFLSMPRQSVDSLCWIAENYEKIMAHDEERCNNVPSILSFWTPIE